MRVELDHARLEFEQHRYETKSIDSEREREKRREEASKRELEKFRVMIETFAKK